MGGQEIVPAADPMPGEAASLPRCENCAAALHGEFCHTCGQSMHSPLRHAGHALEDVFESFWHLDGRIFRTLRDLLVPGRVARNYIAGHRARYVAPLRLFVILSLLTIFVAQCSFQLDPDTRITIDPATGMHIGPGDAAGDAGDNVAMAKATTVAQVEALRDRELADIARARAMIPDHVPAGTIALDAAATELRAKAQRRIAQLQRAARTKAPAPAIADSDSARTTPAAAGTTAEVMKAPPSVPRATEPAVAAQPADAAAKPAPASAMDTDADDDPDTAWDVKPMSVRWLPAFANAWLTRQSDRASRNAVLINKDPRRYLRAVVGAIPSTLFVLVPVFALLLKIFYFLQRRLYLEHLVVALYSHAFLLVSLLAIFSSVTLRHALGESAAPVATVLGWLEGLLWVGMPLYLLVMQKRTYGQGWPMTLLKFCVLGSVYIMLLMFGTVATLFYGLLSM